MVSVIIAVITSTDCRGLINTDLVTVSHILRTLSRSLSLSLQNVFTSQQVPTTQDTARRDHCSTECVAQTPRPDKLVCVSVCVVCAATRVYRPCAYY